jgi:RHS repeat-associated protein
MAYRSGIQNESPIGHNWDYIDDRRLLVVNADNLAEVQMTFDDAKVGDVVRQNGLDRADFYVNNGDGTYTGPNGFFTQLTQETDGSFQERQQDGTIYTYAVPFFNGYSVLTSQADRQGNTMGYQYDPLGRLVTVDDTLGRPIQYQYDAKSELVAVTDFEGRSLRFQYDVHGNLAGMTTPAVTGTPTGNDFPNGKTTRYTYSSGFTNAQLNGELLTVTAPEEVAVGGPPMLVYTYDTNPSHTAFARVVSIQEGGTNQTAVPAGGTITYQYQVIGSAPMGDLTTPVFQDTATDRNGNITQYQFNTVGDILQTKQFNNRDIRPSDPTFYLTTYQYDKDYHVLKDTLPEGNTVQNVYDSSNPDRFQQGNLLETIQTPDAARGGDQAQIVSTFTYEPIYNQVHTMTEPRGNDPSYVPQNGGSNSPARYTTVYTYDYQEGTNFAALGAILGISAAAAQTRLAAAGVPMGLGDINADGRTDQIQGNLIRTQQPTVTLLPGSNEAVVEGTTQQPIVTLSAYNDFGQMIYQVDPELNKTQYQYFSVSNPSGPPIDPAGGGYLAQTLTDTTSNPGRDSGTNPQPANISNQFFYDAVGNVTSSVEGRGITTQYVYNQLNQVVETMSAAAVPGTSPAEPLPLTAFQYVTRYFYDFDNNLVLQEVEDRGNTSNVQGNPPATDLPVLNVQFTDVSTGANTATTLNDTHQSFTANQWAGFVVKITAGPGAGQVRTIVSNSATQLVVNQAWTTLPTAASSFVIYTVINPDPVGGPTAFVDTVYKYDILDQRVEMLQEVSEGTNPEFLRTRYRYDPDGNQVLTIQPEGNATASVYDERNLVYQSTAGATGPPPFALLASGDPKNYNVRGGLAATTTYNYDLNGNLIETVAADDTDGSLANNSKLPSGTSTGGNTATTLNDTSRTWMPNQWQGRTVLIVSGTGAGQLATVVSNTAHQIVLATPWTTVPDATSVYAFQGDRTRFVYDGFDRQTSMIDSVGNQTVSQYDPDGNVIRTSNFGPTGGPSPTSDGPDTLPGPISSGGVIQSGNLVNSNLLSATEYSYDELDRAFQTSKVLFVNTIPMVRTPDVAEGGSDVGLGDLTPGQTQAIPGVSGVTILGRVSDRTEYDRDSRVTFTVEDDLNTARTFYDGVSRVIETVDGAGNTVETAYDGNSNVIETRETDVSQVPGVANEIFLTTNFYDSLNRLQLTVDNLGESMQYRYDSRNDLVAMADADGPVTGATITRRAFPDGPRTVDAINDFGNVTVYFYDGLGRQTIQEQVLTVSGQGDGTHIGASIFGVKNDSSAPASFLPTPDPNQGGGDGLIRTGSLWDANSLQTALLDDNGNITVYLYDDLNRRVTETVGVTVNTPLTKTTILGVRVIPEPTAATLNNPAVIATAPINVQLGEAKLRINTVAGLFPPLANQVEAPTTTITGYDPNNHVLIAQDQNGTEEFTRYDAVSRPIAVRVFRARQHDSFTSDPIFAPAPAHIFLNPGQTTVVVGTTIQNYQYDGLSRRTLATDNNDPATPNVSTVTDAFDSLSRVIEETQQIGGLPAQAIDSAWRADNLRKSLTYPNGRIEVYTYDHLDRTATIADQGASQDTAEYFYIGVDRVLERLFPINGTRETYLDPTGTLDVGYDGVRRPIQESDLRSDNSVIEEFTDTYDRMGNKLTQNQPSYPQYNESYAYDSAYRLISFQRPNLGGVAPLQKSWKLDGVGNWLSVSNTDTETRQYNSTNELIQRQNGTATTGLTFDSNGNETFDGTFAYTYDFMNRLRTVTRKADGALVAVYSYDADGRRAEKVVTNSGSLNGTTVFYLDGWQEIEEHDAGNVVTQQYVYGIYIDEPLIIDRNLNTTPQRLFYYQNTLYSVYALADATASANIVEGYQYDAYGRQSVFDPGTGETSVIFTNGDQITPGGSSAVGNPYMFTGRRLDPELSRLDPQSGQQTGIYYYRARLLDTTQGRFLTRDPLGYTDGPNSYEAYFDPTGTDPMGSKSIFEYIRDFALNNAGASRTWNLFSFPIYGPAVTFNVDLTVYGEIHGCVCAAGQEKKYVEGGATLEAFIMGGRSFKANKERPGPGKPRNERVPDPNRPGQTIKRKNLPPNERAAPGYRERSAYGTAASGLPDCPPEYFNITGSVFIRGSVGFYVGAQFNISQPITRNFDPVSGWSFEGSVAYGVYGASIEVGGGATASFRFYF